MASATYPVVAHYYTLQGEGFWSGRAAYFIRLAGCDVGCPWCDTKESWAIDGHPVVSIDELTAAAERANSSYVVITGGEPTMHDLKPLTDQLKTAGLEVQVETSGAYPLTGSFDWVTLSPKKYKPPVESIYSQTDELKVIVANRSDFSWAEQHLAQCDKSVRPVLQPEWDSPHMLPDIVDYVKQNPIWTISLQTHKYLNIP